MSEWRWPSWAFLGWIAFGVAVLVFLGSTMDADKAAYAFGQFLWIWIIGFVVIGVGLEAVASGAAMSLVRPGLDGVHVPLHALRLLRRHARRRHVPQLQRAGGRAAFRSVRAAVSLRGPDQCRQSPPTSPPASAPGVARSRP